MSAAKMETVLRADEDLVEQIDAYARRLFAMTGARVTRAAAAHALIRLGLRAAEQQKVGR